MPGSSAGRVRRCQTPDTSIAANVSAVNEVFRAEAAKRPWVTYLDAYALTSDAAGNYAQYLIDEHGALVQARDNDGVHFTSAGGKILANAVFYVLISSR